MGMLAMASTAMAQGDPISRYIGQEDLQEDFAIIRQTLEQSHPDPYRYQTRTGVEQLLDSVNGELRGLMTAEDFIRATLPAFRAIGDAGTRLAPPAIAQEAYGHSIPMIPMHVVVIDDHLYLDEELKGFRSLPEGCEILHINGQGAREILARLRSAQVPEGNNTTLLDRHIEDNFPELYRRHVEEANRFVVGYRTQQGEAREQEIFAMTKDEMRQTYRPKGIDLEPWRFEEMTATRSAWLTLATFEMGELDRRRINPERFLGNVANALRKSEAKTLVIDVRGASGHDLAMAERVFSLIAQKPYRVLQSMSIRNGRVPDSYRYAKPEPEFFAAVGGMYAAEINGRRELLSNDTRLMWLKPLSKAFEGKVYVVCDGATTGAAAAFMALSKRSARARTVGEEVGSNAASFCGGRTLEITLPNSGCVLSVPLVRYVLEGTPTGPTDHGEMPHYQVPRLVSDLASGRDTVRGALLQLIAEMQ